MIKQHGAQEAVRPLLPANQRPLKRSGRRTDRVVEEAHLSWKRRLDGYCACTAIVKEGKGRQENEKRMVVGWRRQRAGGHGEENLHSWF
jgi:hypothetical protein